MMGRGVRRLLPWSAAWLSVETYGEGACFGGNTLCCAFVVSE